MTKTYNSQGTEDQLFEYYKYWWEEYDPDRSTNLLTPVIQHTTKNNSTITNIAVTTWRQWSAGKWAPNKSYIWNKIGTASPVFDYAN